MSVRPVEFSSSFIASVTSKACKIHGYCQLLEFHVKKPNIYSCVLSDGNYSVKVMFLDDAGFSLANHDIQQMCVIQCVIHNYSFENAIFLVKSIVSAWPYDKIIGKPKDYRRKKVSDNTQKYIIDWGPNPLPPAISCAGNFTFGIQEVEQENQKQQQNSSLTSSVRETIMKQSSIESQFLDQIVELQEKTPPPRMSQSFQQSSNKNKFTQQDFANFQSILESAAKARECGYTDKIRVTNSTGSLKDLLDVVDLFELAQQPQKQPLNEMDELIDMLGDDKSQTIVIKSSSKSKNTQNIQEQQVIDIDELVQSIKKQPKSIQNLCNLSQLIVSMRDGWSSHIQILAKGQIIHQANNRTVKFHCLVRDTQSIVMAVFYDVQLYSKIEQMEYYYVSDGLVSHCQQCPSQMPQICLEMGRNSKIIEAPPFITSSQKYFTPLNLALKKQQEQYVHTIGILRAMEERPYVKAGQTKYISIYSIIDPITNHQSDVVVFGRLDPTIQPCDIVSLFNVKIKMGRQKKELQFSTSFIRKNIYHKQIHEQLMPYAKVEILNSIVPCYNFQQRSISQLIQLGKMKLIQPNLDINSEVTGRIINIRKDKLFYLACTNCNKKVQQANSKFYCQKCRVNVDIQPRYIVSGLFGSDGGVISLLFEPRLVKKILQQEASQVDLESAGRQLATLEGRLFKIQVTACLGQFNGQTVVKYTLRNMRRVEMQEYQQEMMSKIKKYLQYL